MGSLGIDPIIIIGAGLGGLAFAQGLHKAGIPFKIFERSKSFGVRHQGYRIRLHSEGVSGLRSLVSENVWRIFEESCPGIDLSALPTIDAKTCEISDANFGMSDPRNKMAASTQQPYNADRAVLRGVLMTGLDEHVSFGQEYSHYELTKSGIDAIFSGGMRVAGSLIVGADGARSAVRRQYLPHFRVLDTKSLNIYGKTPLTPPFTSRMMPEAMRCLSFIKDRQDDSLTLIEALRFLPASQRVDKRDLPADYMYWVIILAPMKSPMAETELLRINKDGAADLALKTVRHWHPSLRVMVEEQDRSQTGIYPLLSADPESLSRGWESNARITILGDAAHAMMPSQANGTGTALRDAELLVKSIKLHGVSLAGIAAYEEEMRRYACEAVTVAATIGPKVFGFGKLDDSDEVCIGVNNDPSG